MNFAKIDFLNLEKTRISIIRNKKFPNETPINFWASQTKEITLKKRIFYTNAGNIYNCVVTFKTSCLMLKLLINTINLKIK